MLEVIRVFMTSETKLKSVNEKHLQHDIIFLFNGAEEVMLAGSHAFITKVSV